LKSRPKLEEWLGVACMAALTLITLGNVLVRYLSDRSFAWTEEISVFLIVVMTLAGAAGVARRDGHIRIEYFYEGGSAARRRRLRLLAAAAQASTTPEGLRRLLTAGADANLADYAGVTPHLEAMNAGRDDLAALLVSPAAAHARARLVHRQNG